MFCQLTLRWESNSTGIIVTLETFSSVQQFQIINGMQSEILQNTKKNPKLQLASENNFFFLKIKTIAVSSHDAALMKKQSQSESDSRGIVDPNRPQRRPTFILSWLDNTQDHHRWEYTTLVFQLLKHNKKERVAPFTAR